MVRPVASGGGKTDITKVGLNSVPEGVVKNNLKGISPQMEKKGWVDSQGRKGKVCSVLRCPVGVVDTCAIAGFVSECHHDASKRRQHRGIHIIALCGHCQV